jgi:hypothetical protein
MAKFQGKVTQDGWSVEFETDESDNHTSTTIALALAQTFVQNQTKLQAQGQESIRQAFLTGQIYETDRPTNGQTNDGIEEAETLHDGKTYEGIHP